MLQSVFFFLYPKSKQTKYSGFVKLGVRWAGQDNRVQFQQSNSISEGHYAGALGHILQKGILGNKIQKSA